MPNNKNDFKPYIPAERVVPEFTVTSILIGVLLAIVFGAANAYLGLRVGMTISASIPAAVISMGIIRMILRKDSILENNLVQTIGSAGESVAAGAIFTLPALFLWAKEGVIDPPSMVTISLVALVGGLLGVAFMVPLRQALIVEEHGTLPFPEGTACAEVLLAGEQGGSKASTVFAGLGISALYKFVADGMKVFPSEVNYDITAYKGAAVGVQVLPALAGVGYICGPKISSYMLAGSTLSWLVLMPAIALFGGDAIIFPGNDPISTLAPGDLWGTYIKYIGAGAVAAGGIICIIAAIAGDCSQDLKTGFIVGATPKKQQIGEMIGVIASSVAIGGVMYLLDQAWGYGSDQIPAPQGTMMKMLVEGIMNAQLPWALILIGVFVAIVVEILKIPVMPFAVGMYLPFSLNAGIMCGGIVRFIMERRKAPEEEKKEGIDRGILYTSGLIAGEGLMGVVLAVLAVVGVDKVVDVSGSFSIGNIGALVVFVLLLLSLVRVCLGGKKSK